MQTSKIKDNEDIRDTRDTLFLGSHHIAKSCERKVNEDVIYTFYAAVEITWVRMGPL